MKYAGSFSHGLKIAAQNVTCLTPVYDLKTGHSEIAHCFFGADCFNAGLKQSEGNAHCPLFVLDIGPLIFSAIAPNHEPLIG